MPTRTASRRRSTAPRPRSYSPGVLWKLVDVLVILAAVGLLLMLGPSVIGASRWKKRILGRRD